MSKKKHTVWSPVIRQTEGSQNKSECKKTYIIKLIYVNYEQNYTQETKVPLTTEIHEVNATVHPVALNIL